MTDLEKATEATTEAILHFAEYDPDTDPRSDLVLRVDLLVAALANFANLTARDEIAFQKRSTSPQPDPARNEETRSPAAIALLRLIDQRVQGNAVNPPFELANIAVDQIAAHAIAVANQLRQDGLEVYAHDDPGPSPLPNLPVERPLP